MTIPLPCAIMYPSSVRTIPPVNVGQRASFVLHIGVYRTDAYSRDHHICHDTLSLNDEPFRSEVRSLLRRWSVSINYNLLWIWLFASGKKCPVVGDRPSSKTNMSSLYPCDGMRRWKPDRTVTMAEKMPVVKLPVKFGTGRRQGSTCMEAVGGRKEKVGFKTLCPIGFCVKSAEFFIWRKGSVRLWINSLPAGKWTKKHGKSLTVKAALSGAFLPLPERLRTKKTITARPNPGRICGIFLFLEKTKPFHFKLQV